MSNWQKICGVVIGVCAWSACGSSVGTGSNTGSDSTSGADTQTASDIMTFAEVGPVSRNPKCDKFDDGVYGAKHPWGGFKSGAFNFTCDTCRGGYKAYNGDWRFIDFKTEDPSTSLDGYMETINFNGNTFTNHLAGPDQGKAVDALIKGWYFCTDAVELPEKAEVMALDTVVPDGAFGNKSNSSLFISLKESAESKDLIAIGIYDGMNNKKYLYENLYCRIGSVIKGKPCDDPFKK